MHAPSMHAPSIQASPQPFAQVLGQTVAMAASAAAASTPAHPALPAAAASTASTPLLSPRRPSAQDDSALRRAPAVELPADRKRAQYLDLAAAVTSAPYPIGTIPGALRGVASGGLWAASARYSSRENEQAVAARQAANEGVGRMDWSNRVADASSAIAGVSDAASSAFNAFGSSHGWAATASTATAYASNAFWGAAGAIGFGQGVANWRDAAKSKAASGLQMAGGFFNMVGAGFGMAAAQRQSADPNDSTAAYYGYASAAAWTLGSAATIASNYLTVRAENTRRVADLERGGR